MFKISIIAFTNHIALGEPLLCVCVCVFLYLSGNWVCSEAECENLRGIPFMAQLVKNPTSIHKDAGSIPGLIQ